MNKEFIKQKISNCLSKNNELTYDDFDELFSNFNSKEQYEIIDIIQNELNVQMVDEYTISDDTKKDEDYSKQIVLSVDKYSNEQLIEKYFQYKSYSILNYLIIKNDKFIRSLINKVSKKYGHDLPEEDLFQIACEGFIKGCKRYNKSQNAKLTTYVGYWIMQALDRKIKDEGFLVRIPVHKWENIARIRKIIAQNPTLSVDEILKREKIPKEEYLEMLKIEKNYLSPLYLDARISDDSNTTLLDSISDNTQTIASIDEEFDNKIYLKRNVNNMLKCLSPKEKDVIRLRFGLDDNRQRTLQEVGELFGVSRERIRQIESRGLKKLRKSQKVRSKTPYDEKINEEECLKKEINNKLKYLNPRQRDIVSLYFGLQDNRQRTFKEVGELFEVSSEEIKQTIGKALTKLNNIEDEA